MKKLLFSLLIILTMLGCLKNGALAKVTSPQYKIEIDIPSRSLYYIENDHVLKRYPIAVGKPNSQTPIGSFKVINKVVNPYYSKKKIAGGSPQNPLGSRWMGFKPLYGVHGNSDPKSIGTFVSAGCIRMYDKDVKELYEKVAVGIPVIVKYDPIKVVRDIEGLNPILIVYPDYYSKVQNLTKKVEDKLIELNLVQDIDSNKLAELKKLINKTEVIISDKWVYLINDRYITNDILSIDNNLHINIDKVSRFFNITIYNTEVKETVTILNSNVPITVVDGSRYIPINILETILGGKHTVNQGQQRINHDMKYLLFNNKLVKGDVIGIQETVMISLESIADIYQIDISAYQGNTSILVNDKKINYKALNGKPYVDLNNLIKEIDLISNTFTKDGYVEIISEPKIVFENIEYRGKIVGEDVYLPKELITKMGYSYTNFADDCCSCFNILQNIIKEGEQYFSISKLPKCFFVTKDYYNTKVNIERKICDYVLE